MTFEGQEFPFVARFDSGWWMAETPTTTAQWSSLAPITRYSQGHAAECAVVGVSWDAAVDWCERLTETLPAEVRKTFVASLATECEWEHAARAGTQSRYGIADSISELEELAATRVGAQGTGGWRRPNRWGLYGLVGGVLEWCLDGGWNFPGDNASVAHPFGGLDGEERVLRGCLPAELRRAHICRRLFSPRHIGGYQEGFRVVLRDRAVHGRMLANPGGSSCAAET